MNKQFIKIILAFILSCGIAYLIGQKVVLPITDKKAPQNSQEKRIQNQQQDNQWNEVYNNTETYDLIKDFSNLSLNGQSSVNDNPWGSNLTIFEDEMQGTSLLMMPGTEISVRYVVRGEKILSWRCNIHPWMAEISDGVDLTITVCGIDQDEKEMKETFRVTSSDAYEMDSISLSEFQDMDIQVTLSVGNGENNDSSGDWLVFDRLVILPKQT